MRPGAPVHAVDGDRPGAGLPRQPGRRPGDPRAAPGGAPGAARVAIPITAVTGKDVGIRLNLTKDQVGTCDPLLSRHGTVSRPQEVRGGDEGRRKGSRRHCISGPLATVSSGKLRRRTVSRIGSHVIPLRIRLLTSEGSHDYRHLHEGRRAAHSWSRMVIRPARPRSPCPAVPLILAGQLVTHINTAGSRPPP